MSNIQKTKICPTCRGNGRILCNGREPYRKHYRSWADQFHEKPVVLDVTLGRNNFTIAGIAISTILPGGWPGLKIYFARGHKNQPTPLPDYFHSWAKTERIKGRDFWYITARKKQDTHKVSLLANADPKTEALSNLLFISK